MRYTIRAPRLYHCAPSSRMQVLLLFFVFQALFHSQAAGHGSMVIPRFRSTLATFSLSIPNLIDEPISDCPHCLNGGGKGAVILAAGPAGWRPYTPTKPGKFRRDAGLCGDAIADPPPRAHEVGGTFGPPPQMPFSAVYKSGSVIEMTADITTSHNGFFAFYMCDVTKCGGDINERCFKQGHCQLLKRVKTPECESQMSRECGPVDPDYPGRWYMPCRKGAHVGEHFMGGKYMRYKLPDGFQSRHAVIQWYWVTANSCNPPGFLEYFERFPMPGWGKCPGDGGSQGGRAKHLSDCGGPTFPEEFWMCADVQITPDGKPRTPFKVPPQNFAPPTSTPMPTPTPTPAPEPAKSDDKREDGKKDERQNGNSNMQNGNGNKDSRRDVPREEELNRCRALLGLQISKPKPPPTSSPVRKPPRTKPQAQGKQKAKCAMNWKQCGGRYYKGPENCCGKAYKCVYINKYYAHCKAPQKQKAKRTRKQARKQEHVPSRARWQKQRNYPN